MSDVPLNEPALSFASLARSFLASNPRLLDTFVSILHNIADELEGLKNSRMISQGGYMHTYKFKQKVLDKIMRKLGYTTSDIPDICNQGRADEILQEIDRMERAPLLGSVSPSRRVLPSPTHSTYRSTPRFEDITDQSRTSNK